MILDRTLAPAFQTIDQIHFPLLQQVKSDNNLPIHIINIGQQEVFRLDVVFDAGSWFDSIPTTSFFTTKLLSEGTSNFSSVQISEYFDNLGAFLDLGQGFERSNISVYGLTKHLEAILVMVRELMFEAIFPENELKNLQKTAKQGLQINLEKNAYLANINVKERLFGANHPYGRAFKAENIDKISVETLKGFYGERIKNQSFTVFLSGKITDKETKLVNQYLGQHQIEKSVAVRKEHEIVSDFDEWHLEKGDSLQTSVRVGRLLFTRNHPDFFKFIVCNELFGGYFGSRLMKNIREDKGFTYGISSSLVPMNKAGYWCINTDVKKESKAATFDEIEKEMKRLQTELVPKTELETAINYMSGAFAGSLNTPFEIADRVRLMVQENLEPDYYNQYIGKIRAVTAEQVMEMANKYLKFDDLLKVSVG